MIKEKSINKLEGYTNLLKEIRYILQKGLSKAYKAVDNIRVQTYWQMGERIVREELQQKDRADYGKNIVILLAPEIGVDEQTLRHIIRFYRTYPILSAVRRELSWTHYKTLIYIANKEEKYFYEIQSIINCWSTRELEKRIRNKDYVKARKKREIVVKLPKQLPAPEEVFKDSYNFNFLNLRKEHNENDLETALVNNVKKLLLEFGTDFALAGRQRKMVVDGQMNKFLNYYRENNKYPWEKDPVGLIICEYKGSEEVHYATGNIQNKIFVAEI